MVKRKTTKIQSTKILKEALISFLIALPLHIDIDNINDFKQEYITNMMISTFKLSTFHFSAMPYYLPKCMYIYISIDVLRSCMFTVTIHMFYGFFFKSF